MVHSPCRLAVTLIAGLLFATGCGTSHPPSATRAARSSCPARATTQTPADDERSLAQSAKAHAHYAAGVVHELNQESDLALEEFREAALNDPDNEALILDVSRRLLERKQPAKALELVQPAAARPGASGAMLARLSFLYAQLGKTDQAIETARAVIKKSPRSLAGYQCLSQSLAVAGQSDAGLRVLDEAAKQPEVSPEFLIALAELYAGYTVQIPSQREAIRARALAALDRVPRIAAANVPLRLKLADGLHQLGASDKAAPIYLDLLAQLDDAPGLREGVRSKLAEIFLRGGDPKRAAEQLEAIVREDPANAAAYFYLGNLALDEQRAKDAADYLKKALLFNPELEPAYYELANAQIAMNDVAGAVETLEVARKKFRQSFGLEYLTGMAEGRRKNYTAAIAHFTAAEVVASAGDSKRLTHEFYFQFGATCERNGDREQAVKHFQKSLELKPDFDAALNYLGYMWAERGEKLDQARDLIEKALKVEPKNAAYLDSMGWVLFKQNQPKEALGYILKAVDLNEEPDATLFDHLGDIYSALDEPEKAREAWRKSLGVESSEVVKQKLEASPAR